MITIITIILIVFFWLVKDLRHEAIGSKYLSKYFPDSVVQAISLHVAAKRYLTAIDQEYQSGLSDASKKRLLQHDLHVAVSLPMSSSDEHNVAL